MNEVIIPPKPPPAQADPTRLPAWHAPHCPQCAAACQVHVHYTGGWIGCQSCETTWVLQAEEAGDFCDGMFGQTDTPFDPDLFLQAVVARIQGGGDPPPPPARAYAYRNARVAAEVAALPPAHAPAFLGAALSCTEPETAVTAIRRLLVAGDAATARTVGEHLYSLTYPRLAKIGRHYFPYQADPAADLAAELALQVWRAVGDPAPAHAFWSFNFWTCVNRDAPTLAARLYRPLRAEHPFLYDPDGTSNQGDLVALTGDPTDALAAADLLALLPPPARAAMVLLARGFSTREIAARLGVTDRTIRHWRGHASRRLTAAGYTATGAGEPSPAPKGAHWYPAIIARRTLCALPLQEVAA